MVSSLVQFYSLVVKDNKLAGSLSSLVHFVILHNSSIKIAQITNHEVISIYA